MHPKTIFQLLYNAATENEVEKIIKQYKNEFADENWKPLGGNSSNYSIVKNQQANPIAALIEKITNSIDAILTKKCLQAGIDPKSSEAPRSINEAVEQFFPDKNWDLDSFRREQAKDIQIIADGPTKDTSVIIYDNGEGQHPDDFETSFLSLISGNKKNIHFVQGKYNMGGSGALVFCGKKRFQLIASKKYDGTGDFGFTLIREHPLTEAEQYESKETWYEYWTLGGVIPRFSIDDINLNLFDRRFKTGSIIKMYSYQFPLGYSGFAQELNQSINEYLFKPALPVYTVDSKKRYPNNKILELDLFGLQRRLDKESEKDGYVEDYFSEDFNTALFGKSKVTAYLFKSKYKDQDAKKTKDNIRRRFFKNDMAVVFSLNGQVHGHFTSEFITRSLKLNLLKNHLLIHADCTEMKYEFRKELFMASRDRLKNGEETKALRAFLAKELSKKDSALVEIEKYRKDSISADSSDTKELLKSFTKNLPMDSELMKLLNQTFKLDQVADKPKKPQKSGNKKDQKPKEPFRGERFPTQFNIKGSSKDGVTVINIPRGSEKTIQFDTDVENHYFDRVDEPGELQLGLVNYKTNETEGGDKPGKPTKVEDVFNINKSSPKDGTIRVSLNPKIDVRVGDEIEMKVTLTAPGEGIPEVFWAKITNPEAKKEKIQKEEVDEPLGLPPFELVFKEEKEDKNVLTWDKLEDISIPMDYETVMYPLGRGESELEKIFINMDSTVFKSFKSKYRNPSEEQLKMAENKYISSVYFHTLFLYTITKNRGYQIVKSEKDKNEPEPIDLADYLKDVFDNFYSTFILNYGGMEEMMTGLGD